MKARLYTVRFLIVSFMLSLCPALCHAEPRCLWLNTATTEGFLRGGVSVTIVPLTVPGDQSCEFSLKEGSAASMVRITVYTMNAPAKEFASYLAQCKGAVAPLKGIGNEAVQCLRKEDSLNLEERMIGRVRGRATLINLRDDIRNIAEQVAGSLF